MFSVLRLLIFFLLLVIIPPAACALAPTDETDPNNPHLSYLEHLVKTKIDSIRPDPGLYPLVNYSILYIPSKDHAGYLVRKKTLSHFEDKSSKKTPQKRAEYYKEKNYVWMNKQLRRIGEVDRITPGTLELLAMSFHFNAVSYCLIHPSEENEKFRHRGPNTIYRYCLKHNPPDTVALKVARLFLWHGENDRAYSLLKRYALKKEPNQELLMLFLKMSYVHCGEDPRNGFNKWLLDAANILTDKEGCEMIGGICNMSFQVLDNKKVHNVYCEKCGDYLGLNERYRATKKRLLEKKQP